MGNLPTPGGDSNVWGNELNAWLLADHDIDGTHSFTTFNAADHGMLAWNFDPVMVSSTGGTLTNGSVFLSRINVRYPLSVVNVTVSLGSAGLGLTANQNFAALFNSAGTRIGITADQSTNWSTGWTAANAAPAIPLVGNPFSISTGFYWVAVLANGATTPTLARSGNGLTATINNGLVVSTARSATALTGQSTIPTTITPSSNTFNSLPYWCALS